jgi:UDP-perosamine 4-acetyltransferase
MKRIVLCGAGGHAKVVLEAVRATGQFQDIILVDADTALAGKGLLGDEVYPLADLEDIRRSGYDGFLVCIGDNIARSINYQRFLRSGFEPVIATHPSALVSPSAEIGLGTVILPRAVINAQAKIGQNCIINTGAIVEHDCVIGDHVHVSPGAALGGRAVLESSVHVGLNASVLPGVSIGNCSIVGAGAVVVKNVPEGVVVVGVPARIKRSLPTNL